ncbi:Vegetative incompatibility protein HET-E-1 [Penicillium pulvis]|uniref:Vegetative incompatibility protein HET-E-1 n=1 Tax=Penicillium pulvis TaxID=1562058 RepID=UPI002547B1A9|nr:Vegetative incompatibility protein HET-E-1 [Penicillium pulvis]KAJ5785261.1 Vegetative incompatibility protein HET-E-1 [Penicillium pulvis]
MQSLNPLISFPNKSTYRQMKTAYGIRMTDPRDDKQRIEELSGGLLKEVYIWILDNVYFKRWRYERQDQLLRISGAPGQGKTMLVCGIIDELINFASETSMKPAAKTPIVSFIFCQANDTRTNTANAVLRGLIFMLVDQRPSLISHIRQYYDKRGKQLFQDAYAWETLSQILISILQDPR